MHKKLEADLMSLAHSILQMKNKEDVLALKEKSKEIYEKLSLLAFVEEYVNTTPNLEVTQEDLIDKVEKGLTLKEAKVITSTAIVGGAIEEKEEKEEFLPVEGLVEELISDVIEEEIIIEEKEDVQVEAVVEEIIEQPFDELEEIMFAEPEPVEIKEEVKLEEELEDVISENEIEEDLIEEVAEVQEKEKSKVLSLEEELVDTISVDEIATLFDVPVAAPKSLNDRLASNIQIGLNDRIAFVKNLFEGSQEDFNRVVSQLNTYGTEKEALKFINKMVKPDYDWSNQQELEARFMEIVARKFA